MAFEFLRPILTPNALATLQANPILVAFTIIWLLAIILIGVGAWYISFVTGKKYKKPLKPGQRRRWTPEALHGVADKIQVIRWNIGEMWWRMKGKG